MSNYCASARSNYFRVKNKQAFEKWCNSRELELIFKTDEKAGDKLCGFIVNSEYGSIPNYTNGEEFDFFAELSTHLVEGEVAITIEVGQEKMRYLCGFANAINSKGEIISIDLDEIYEKAKPLGSNITTVAY